MKFLLALAFPVALAAQNVRPVPPPGIEVPAADRAEIEAGVKQLAEAIAPLKKDAKLAGDVPNVEIFHKSADWALRYNEIFDAKQIPIAKDHIKQGLERAAALAKGEMPWNKQTGLLVRAYRSNIDGSVQPYGLVIPADWKPDDGKQRRLDFWCHGRGEKLSELAFIADRQKNPGEFVPEGAIVCHLYGRYCCANKFAGETDLFEALEDIKKHYSIDERRLVIRGFSMGGASTWQFATHYPGMWAAAAPGAGFAETAEFFKVFADGKEAPPAWEQKLWRWYDCTTMAANLSNTSVVAYSGEIDGQKQAADIMVKYAAQEGISFPHIIGPKTAHSYHKDSKPEVEKLVTEAVEKRPDVRKKLRFVTYSLAYPSMDWVTIHEMEKQWEKAEINAEIAGDRSLNITTKNVGWLMIRFPGLRWDYKKRDYVNSAGKISADEEFGAVIIDGKRMEKKGGKSFWALKEKDGWYMTNTVSGPREDHKDSGTCGPIDHAFMSKFVFVRPTGKPLNDAVGEWANSEMEHAIASWRKVFRGDVQVMDDTEALTQFKSTPIELRKGKLLYDANLIVWGDPSSNRLLGYLLDSELDKAPEQRVSKPGPTLPLKWDAKTLALGTQKVDAAHHVPILIYPSVHRYIVLNSGFTFREAAALNNSDQTPKLPDWAVVDIRTPPGPKWPGKIVDAGFFDENWK